MATQETNSKRILCPSAIPASAAHAHAAADAPNFSNSWARLCAPLCTHQLRSQTSVGYVIPELETAVTVTRGVVFTQTETLAVLSPTKVPQPELILSIPPNGDVQGDFTGKSYFAKSTGGLFTA